MVPMVSDDKAHNGYTSIQHWLLMGHGRGRGKLKRDISNSYLANLSPFEDLICHSIRLFLGRRRSHALRPVPSDGHLAGRGAGVCRCGLQMQIANADCRWGTSGRVIKWIFWQRIQKWFPKVWPGDEEVSTRAGLG